MLIKYSDITGSYVEGLTEINNTSNYSQSTTNKMWCFSIYLFLQDALRVSDSFSIHHQELKTEHTVSGICQTVMTWLKQIASNSVYKL
jgi:hypothetical protein